MKAKAYLTSRILKAYDIRCRILNPDASLVKFEIFLAIVQEDPISEVVDDEGVDSVSESEAGQVGV